MNANQVARAQGKPKANPDDYAMYDDWLLRQVEAGHEFRQQAPPELAAKLEELIGKLTDNLVDVCLGVTGKAICEIRKDNEVTQEVLRRRVREQDAEIAMLRSTLEDKETELKDRTGECVNLEAVVESLETQREVLRGRLDEQRKMIDGLLAAARRSGEVFVEAAGATASDSNGEDEPSTPINAIYINESDLE